MSLDFIIGIIEIEGNPVFNSYKSQTVNFILKNTSGIIHKDPSNKKVISSQCIWGLGEISPQLSPALRLEMLKELI